MSNDNDWLSQVKARLKAATPGRWQHIPGDSFMAQSLVRVDPNNRDTDEDIYVPTIPDDAELIAHAPSDLDKAIRIIECYERALDHYSKLQDWDLLPVIAIDALAKAEKIKGEG